MCIYYDTYTQYAHFRGNPLRQATKRHLNNSYTVKNDEKLERNISFFPSDLLSLVQCWEEKKKDFLLLLLLLCFVLWLEENLHMVCPCHNK